MHQNRQHVSNHADCLEDDINNIYSAFVMFISSLVAADDLEHDDTVPRDSEEDTLLKHKADKHKTSSVIATSSE